jgi:hypothetical protein
MMGIGTPKSQSRMPLPMIFLLNVVRGVRAIVPDAIAQPSAAKRRTKRAQQSAKTRIQRVSSATEHIKPRPRRLKCEDGRGQCFGAGNRSYCTELLFTGVGRPLENLRNAQEVLAGFFSCDGLSVRLIVAGLLFRQGVPPMRSLR